ncbi:MAG: hypothetical protein FVQ84_08275 [Planctomycetes bacterium]|nr:hypothetical protein [Planctomycetota bacterium]
MQKWELFSRGERQKKTFNRVIFVDPGLGGTGWAYWEEVCNVPHFPTRPSETGVIKGNNKSGWENKSSEINSQFAGVLNNLNVERVCIEWPAIFNTGLSHASASRGDLFKLVYVIGGLGEVSQTVTNRKPLLFSPSDWKGQLPKEVVIRRIKKIFPMMLRIRNHEGDAIGMGLAAQGALTK